MYKGIIMKKLLAVVIIVVAFFSIKAVTLENDRYFEILKNRAGKVPRASCLAGFSG